MSLFEWEFFLTESLLYPESFRVSKDRYRMLNMFIRMLGITSNVRHISWPKFVRWILNLVAQDLEICQLKQSRVTVLHYNYGKRK